MKMLIAFLLAASIWMQADANTPDAYSLDSINKLYVKDSQLAIERMLTLKERCEADNWEKCSRAQFEITFARIHSYRNEIWRAQKHAFEALKASQFDKDKKWKLLALQIICSTFYKRNNWALLGKYSRIMKQEAQGHDPWYVAVSEIYAAASEGYTGQPGKAQKRLEAAERYLTETAQKHPEAGINTDAFVCTVRDKQIDICQLSGNHDEAYRISLEYAELIDTIERKLPPGKDADAIALARLLLFSRLANIAHRLGKDGTVWYEKAKEIHRRLPEETKPVINMADFLFATGNHKEYERVIVPKLNGYGDKPASPEVLHLIWQWLTILAENGRYEEQKTWLGKGLVMATEMASNRNMHAEVEFSLAYNGEIHKEEIARHMAELEISRLKFGMAVAAVIVLITAFSAMIIYNRKQRHNIRHLYGMIEENRKKNILNDALIMHESNKGSGGNSADADEEDVRLMAELQKYLRNGGRFRSGELSLDDICRNVGVSQKRLTAAVQKIKGMTVMGYARDMRLEYACSLLRDDSSMKVETVALESGYNSLRQFLRMFKGKYNITPTEYRRLCNSRQEQAANGTDDDTPYIGSTSK